jgi:formate hydrogenlyase transcriptional activator
MPRELDTTGETTGEATIAAAERYRTLLDINNAIISNLTQEALFRAVAAAVRRVVPFDRCAVFLHDAGADVLRLFVLESSLPSAYFSVGLTMAPMDSHVGLVFKEQRPLVRRDLTHERVFPAEDAAYRDGVRSYAIVPMIVRGRSLGVLAVASTTPARYGPSDVAFLQEAANQVALAIENMKAYEEIAALKARLEHENVYLQEEIRRDHNFVELVGSSPALLEVLGKVEQVAPTDSTVLITGETGTGKELVARALHDLSRRKHRPLVKVNCSAISAGLVESELFGHVKGAFTGALDRRVGRFEVADGGTIFLDEVGELPLETQVKLLRVLQEREFEPVGSNRSIRTWIYRIATNLALNKRRGKRREVEVPLDDHLPTFQPDGHRAGDRAFLLADWSDSPEVAVLTDETRRHVWKAIDALPDHYRAVLVLRDLEELSSEETAEILGESVASVKSRLHRARMGVRELLTRAMSA